MARWRGTILLISMLAIGVPMSTSAPANSYRARLERLRKDRARPPRGKAAQPQGSPKPLAEEDASYIDELLEQEWEALGFAVSEPCTDGEFVRRASLDILGRIPTLAETEEFLRLRHPDKRRQWIDRLLDRPEYGKNFATIWTGLMITTGNAAGNNRNINPEGLSAWLEREFNRNTSWQKIVTELISATGRWDENGAVNFVIANEMGNNTTQLTAYMTRLFLCVQTQCVECHDHPWNEWRQEQFHGLNAFFLGTRKRQVSKTSANGQMATDYYVLEEVPYSEVRQRGTFFERRNGLQVFVPPTYLDGRDLEALRRGEKARGTERKLVAMDELLKEAARFEPDAGDRTSPSEPVYLRRELAKALTADDNPYFARAIVNRMWRHYLGHSFLKDVDDFDNGQDEPSMPELLNRLAADFVRHGYDLKRLSRWICSSEAYSHSSRRRGKENDEAKAFFVAMLPKPMTPEQLYDSVMTLTEIQKAAKAGEATALRSAFLNSFRRTFGGDEIQTSAPRYNGTITQALMMMNSPEMTAACACMPGGFLHRVATDASLSPEKKVERLYLAALSRKPNSAEMRVINRMFREMGRDQMEVGYSNILWAILNSAEFLLNH